MDRARFVNLALEEWPVVHRFARRLARDPNLAEDLIQDVYEQALRSARSHAFEPRGGGLRAWLLRITYRTHLARSARARCERELFQVYEEGEAPHFGLVEGASARTFDWEEVDGRLRNAVAELDPGAREVLMLWAVEELHYQEIADVLSIPLGTVMSRLHRARARTSRALLADPAAVESLGLRPAEGPRALATEGGTRP